MSNDDLILFGEGEDQSLPTEDDFLYLRQRIASLTQSALENADLDKATHLVRSLVRVAKVSGRELARVLYQFSLHWADFRVEESFEEWADRTTGLHPHTVERYVRVEALFDLPLPEEVRTDLTDRNLAELFPIANMTAQGYDPSPEQWEKLIRQPDEASIRAVVREIKEAEPRPSALVLRVDEHGSIWGHRDSRRKFVGSLEVADEDPIVQQAIERIRRTAGMIK